ncbi:MAG TPA: hypothetical protein VMH78_08380, partial [Thermoplasmata archaeon]|nr:hypothetical protein [Thermoplasmata archaeon]
AAAPGTSTLIVFRPPYVASGAVAMTNTTAGCASLGLPFAPWGSNLSGRGGFAARASDVSCAAATNTSFYSPAAAFAGSYLKGSSSYVQSAWGWQGPTVAGSTGANQLVARVVLDLSGSVTQRVGSCRPTGSSAYDCAQATVVGVTGQLMLVDSSGAVAIYTPEVTMGWGVAVYQACSGASSCSVRYTNASALGPIPSTTIPETFYINYTLVSGHTYGCEVVLTETVATFDGHGLNGGRLLGAQDSASLSLRSVVTSFLLR